jgi:hypothetical protein
MITAQTPSAFVAREKWLSEKIMLKLQAFRSGG